jgi:hypothetical protein
MAARMALTSKGGGACASNAPEPAIKLITAAAIFGQECFIDFIDVHPLISDHCSKKTQAQPARSRHGAARAPE